MYYVRIRGEQRYATRRGGFQDGQKGAKRFRTWERAGSLIRNLELNSGYKLKLEFVSEFDEGFWETLN